MKKLNVKQLENVNGGFTDSDFPFFPQHNPFPFFTDQQSRENEKTTRRWLNDRMQKHNN